MPVTTPTIVPRKSVGLFALLAVLMVILSYVVIISVAIACVYLPYLILTSTQSGNFQLLLLQVGGIAVAGAILWSLVPRRDKFEAPGLLLDRTSHPRLFGELDAIALALNEPLPSEVYLIGQPNAFVSDRGGIMGVGSRRIMAIGLPLLSSLTIPEIRAVLAHEFAHYYSGDTKLGPWVYKTQTAMVRAFQNMGSLSKFGRIGALQAVNLAVSHLLRWYFILFLRVTNFISRQKEYRADELASLTAGAQPLVRGLRKIHGAAMAWGAYWNTEVVPALNQGCMPEIGDGFARFLGAPDIAVQVANGISKEIAEGKAQPYDTHPPLRDRIVAIEKLPSGPVDEKSASALLLLDHVETAEQKFVEQMNPQLAKQSLMRVGWDDIGRNVFIPTWRARVSENAKLLEGITAESLPEAIRRLPQIGSQMRDPKGMLLAPAQRTERAGHLIATALGLVLIDNGWQLEAQPGQFYLYRGEQRLNVLSVARDLYEGKMPADAWRSLCDELRIAGLPLASTSEAPAEPKQKQVSAPPESQN